jgi:hypothetical protein
LLWCVRGQAWNKEISPWDDRLGDEFRAPIFRRLIAKE